MSRRENERYLLAARELARREAMAPMIYYEPHEGQKRMHDCIREHRITIVHSANRFGKSHANAAEIVAHMYGYRPWEVPGLKLTDQGDYPPREEVPREYWLTNAEGIPLLMPNKHLCATGLPARQGLLSTMWPKIEAFLPPAVRRNSGFRVLRGAQSVPLVVFFPSDLSTRGGEIHFASGEQDPMAYEAQSFGSASIDEPPKRAIWGALWRGMTDHMARLWMTATPVGPNAPWVFERFILRDTEEARDLDVGTVQGSIWENPHVSDRAKKEFLSGGQFTEEERQARELGEWSMLTHQAFPQFDPAVHVVPAQTPIPPGAILGVSCDPAHRRPFMFVWGAWAGDGSLLIYDEWPREDHSEMRSSPFVVHDYKKIVLEVEQGCEMDYRVLDPRFGAAKPTSKGERSTSIQEDFAALDMIWDCQLEGTEREEIGIERIRDMLRWDRERPLSPNNRPMLRVRANCKNVLKALQYSVFTPTRDPDVLSDKLAEKYKDARDALRYLVLYNYIPRGAQDGLSYIDQEDLERNNNNMEDWW